MKMKLDNCNSLLVDKECVSVGKMLDHAVHSLHLNADSFFDEGMAPVRAGYFFSWPAADQ